MQMDAPRLRQRLRQFLDELPAILHPVFLSSPLWRGGVSDSRRKCGKENCRCTRGELHVSPYLADRSGEKQRSFTLEGGDLRLFTTMTEDYRAVRSARAELVKITREMLGILDALEEARRERGLRRHGKRLSNRGKKSSS